MTSETLTAEAIVPASVAIQLAKDLAEEIFDESNSPCLSYDCQNAKCKGWIATLQSLKEEYKDLQDREPDADVEIEPDDWYDGLIEWALEYTKEQGLLEDFAHIASHALAEVNFETFEELLEAGYSPQQIYNTFSKYLKEYTILDEFCYLKDDYPEVKEFLKEQGYKCDGDEE